MRKFLLRPGQMAILIRTLLAALTFMCCIYATLQRLSAEEATVRVTNVRRVFHNGEHNAFTDLIRFGDRYFLTFRSCPDGHMVHPTSSIRILASEDLQAWSEVHQFSVPLRDTRDPHFMIFNERLFVYSGTWYSGETTLPRNEYDLNKHLGYAVVTDDGSDWSQPIMLEGTFGHYIWRAAAHGDRAYLCGRRKHEFDIRSRGEGAIVESAMLESEDGLVWKTRALFQEQRGDETAFQFADDGSLLAVSRSGSDPAQLLRSQPPYEQWDRKSLESYVGGPLLAKWGQRWLVGGRQSTSEGPRTALYWLVDDRLEQCATLPSGGDNSYPGFIALSDTRAVVSWYSSHETDDAGEPITAIYMADLILDQSQVSQLPERTRIEVTSTYDGSKQPSYLSVPHELDQGATQATTHARRPLVVSLHSWSGDLEQRQPELESLLAERKWYCLQPNFRGVNNHPLACASQAAQQDILDAVDWVLARYPIDPARVYLTGNSGGGHMTLMMAARYPHRWAAASAWVGISDLSDWHVTHRTGRYGEMLRACCGGAPGSSREVDAEYHKRSPIHFLKNASHVALDICAGIHDGHDGSVPIRHSLLAFNEVAQANSAPLISPAEIAQLSRRDGRLEKPLEGDVGFDSTFGRQHYLRRHVGSARVTIFKGGHEGIASATMAWFE